MRHLELQVQHQYEALILFYWLASTLVTVVHYHLDSINPAKSLSKSKRKKAMFVNKAHIFSQDPVLCLSWFPLIFFALLQ